MVAIQKFVNQQMVRVRDAAGALGAVWQRLQRTIDADTNAAARGLPDNGAKAGFVRELRQQIAAARAGEAAVEANQIWIDGYVSERRTWAPVFAARFSKTEFARALARPDQATVLAVELPDAPGRYVSPTPQAEAIPPQVTPAQLAELASLRSLLANASSAELKRDAHSAFVTGDLRRLASILNASEHRAEQKPADEAARVAAVDAQRYIESLAVPEYEAIQRDLALLVGYGEAAHNWRQAIIQNDPAVEASVNERERNERAERAQAFYSRIEAA